MVVTGRGPGKPPQRGRKGLRSLSATGKDKRTARSAEGQEAPETAVQGRRQEGRDYLSGTQETAARCCRSRKWRRMSA